MYQPTIKKTERLYRWWPRSNIMRRLVRCLLWLPLPVSLLGVFATSFSDTCRNSEGPSYVSPDGQLKAVVFGRDCGATTGSTHISLLFATNKLSTEAGDLFIADSDHRAAPYAKWGGPPVKVHWKSNTNLQIFYPAKARIFYPENHAVAQEVSFNHTITVEYKKYKDE